MKKIKIIMASAFILATSAAFVTKTNMNKPNLTQYYVKVNGTGSCQSTTCVPGSTGTLCSANDTYWTSNDENVNCNNQITGSFKRP